MQGLFISVIRSHTIDNLYNSAFYKLSQNCPFRVHFKSWKLNQSNGRKLMLTNFKENILSLKMVLKELTIFLPVIKYVFDDLSCPLTHLTHRCQLSFDEGHFSYGLKYAEIMPLYKCKNATLHHCLKITELVVCSHLLKFCFTDYMITL